MNVLNFYLDTQIRGNVRQRCSFHFRIPNYHCSHETHILVNTANDDGDDDGPVSILSPILAMAYDGETSLATANEAGIVLINNISNLKSKASFELHQNAIFDIKWRPNEPNQLLTASGDLSISLVDIESSAEKKAHITTSHTGSVRTIDFQDSNVFASGARDGHIKIWDLRDSSKSVIDIAFAHDVKTKTIKRGRKRFRSCPTNVVTSVLFNDYQLYSGGASDGVIKVWDTRKRTKNKLQPLHEIPYDGSPSFSDKQGFTCLHMSKGLLFASCSDNIVYCYSPQLKKMIGRYQGARLNNFTRLALIEDEFLVSGSMNKCVCVWKLNEKPQEKGSVTLPSYVLPEDNEVAAIDVVSKLGLIFSGTDEGRLRRWTFEPLDKNESEPERYYEKAIVYQKKTETVDEIEQEIEEIENNSLNTTSSDVLNESLPRIEPSRVENIKPTPRGKPRKPQLKRKSPRSYSPKVKKSAKTKHQPSEPLTPITNYYQKVPKKNTPP